MSKPRWKLTVLSPIASRLTDLRKRFSEAIWQNPNTVTLSVFLEFLLDEWDRSLPRDVTELRQLMRKYPKRGWQNQSRVVKSKDEPSPDADGRDHTSDGPPEDAEAGD